MKQEKHDKYFEAILQLRPATDEVITFVKNQLDKNPKIFISKEVLLKKVNGLDIYLSDRKFTKSLGTKLKKHFKGSMLKLSRSVHSKDRMSSKIRYRLTVLIRLKEEENL